MMYTAPAAVAPAVAPDAVAPGACVPRRPVRTVLARAARGIAAVIAFYAAVLLAGSFVGAWAFLRVLTPSMTPHIPVDSVIFVRPVDVADVKVGDVIAFKNPNDGSSIVVHRVVAREGSPAGPVFRTKGDANAGSDPWALRLDDGGVHRVGTVVPVPPALTQLVVQPWLRLGLLVATVIAGGWSLLGALGRRPEPDETH